MGTDKNIAVARYYGGDIYDLEVCKTICEHAGMTEDWKNATMENLEGLVEKALEKLNEN